MLTTQHCLNRVGYVVLTKNNIQNKQFRKATIRQQVNRAKPFKFTIVNLEGQLGKDDSKPKIKGDFLRYRAGIKLVKDVRNLQGWDVALEGSGQLIGYVQRVECSGEGSLQQYQLRIVCSETVLGTSQQQLIPAVPDIVTHLDVKQELLLISPPQGLLQLGSTQSKVEYLRQELQPYIQLRKVGSTSIPWMPSQPQLAEANRQDLIKLIKEVGGVSVVGQLLGMRVARKPKGYWEDLQILDQEIMWFVASTWTEHQGIEEGDIYYYNQVSGRITWNKPQSPQQVTLDDEGSYIYIEDKRDRFMPRQKDIKSAGRLDLHTGIVNNGGYQIVSQVLERKVYKPLYRLSLKHTIQIIQEIQTEYGLDPDLIPSSKTLNELGYNGVIAAIQKHGGFVEVAKKMGVRHSRSRKWGYWHDIDNVVKEMKLYLAETQQDKTRYLPSHKELNAAGRSDLRYGVQLHGSKNVAQQMGLLVKRKNWMQNKNQQHDKNINRKIQRGQE